MVTGEHPPIPGEAAKLLPLLAFDYSLDAIVAMNGSGVVVGWNPAAERLFGWSEAETLGQAVADLIVPPQYRQAHREGLQRLSETGQGPVLGNVLDHLTAVDRNGREFPIEIRISKAGVAGGSPVFIAFMSDITARKTIELALREARQAAEDANRAKSDYVSRMSHELRTPLTAILGYADLLRLDSPREDQRTRVDAILRATSHLLSLINDVLDIARAESGHEFLSPEPVRLGGVVAECLSLVAPRAVTRRITLSTVQPKGELYARADRQRLRQVLLNLLSNAIKYTGADGTVTIVSERSGKDHVRLAVTDSGPGIPDDQMSRIFEPFERLGAERGPVEGSGLGLALSRRLVEAMGGTLGVESTPSTGSTFWVLLERTTAPPGPRGEVAARESPSSASDTHEHPARTVLCVEDNLATVELIEEIFERRPGLRLMTAMRGEDAVRLAVEHRPALILLDMHLPDINGDLVLERLKSAAETRDIPVVMLSADATERQVQRMLDAGARQYVTKPVRVRELLKTVDEIVG